MGKVFPFIYDVAMKPLENRSFKNIRREIISKANGHVLEIGSGTGINFPFYLKADKVDAIEPNLEMLQQSYKRVKQATVPIEIHQLSAENLSFQDNTFDSVVATLVFCTISDPVQALKEIRRVAKPKAKILFFEHVRLDQPLLAKAQDLLNPIWKKVCDGCNINRTTLNTIMEAGLTIKNVKSFYKGLFIVVETENEATI